MFEHLVNIYKHNYGTEISFCDGETISRIKRFSESIGVKFDAELEAIFVLYGKQIKGTGLFFGNEYHGFKGMVSSYQLLKDIYIEEPELNINSRPKIPDRTIQDVWFSEYWIPIAGEKNGQYVFVDLDPGPKGISGQIIGVSSDDDYIFKLSDNLSDYVELIANLISRKLYSPGEFTSLYDYLVSRQ